MRIEGQSGELICKSCGNHFTGRYCNNCGEKIITDHDKRIGHFFEEAFHFLTHFEGKFFNTLKAIFTAPGLLSYDYCNGRRKPYFRPLSFYMLIVILYLIFPLFSGLNMELRFYNHLGLFSGINQEMIRQKLEATGYTFEKLSEVFHQKSEKVSKLMLITIIPMAAVVIKALFPRRRKYFYEYLIISTEISSFFIIFTFFILALIMLGLKYQPFFDIDTKNESPLLFYSNLLIVGLFSAIAFRRFFDQKLWVTVLKTLVFVPFFSVVIYFLYKFILFFVTMAMVH